MRNLRVLVSLSTLVATAGCVETMGSGYPAPSYSSGYYSQPTYYSRPSYYSTPQPVVVTQTRYVPVPVSQPRSSYRGLRDSDGDGIPNRYDRDKNGDGVPDRYQRRRY